MSHTYFLCDVVSYFAITEAPTSPANQFVRNIIQLQVPTRRRTGPEGWVQGDRDRHLRP